MTLEDRDDGPGAQVFRAAPRMFILVGVPAALGCSLGIAVGGKSGDWCVLGGFAALSFILFGLVILLKLELAAAGFRYRALIGSRKVAYPDVAAAFIHAVHVAGNPREFAKFAVETREGRLIRPALRAFPIEAAAALFAALEAHGIGIDVADSPGPRRMNDEIRAVQARLRT